jgi:glyoxylase I family protein
MPILERMLHMALTETCESARSGISECWVSNSSGSSRSSLVRPGYRACCFLHPDGRFLIGLCNHAGRTEDEFSPLRTGLDHVAFEVSDRQELDSWARQLDEMGVVRSPDRELGHSFFISLEDPDRIQLELWVTITPHVPQRLG